MNLLNLKLPFSVLANGDFGIAIGATTFYPYVDGNAVGATPAGIRVEVVLPNNKFEKIIVKLPGLNHPISPESFLSGESNFKVRFSADFVGRFYRTPSGEYALSCKANEIEILK